ncbi:uncharacterized protein V2V93DRAFT_362502 [Kockiozyma suomiensis]|uniref:uncharacterized protein n=1 Tax=Kockiozyma suomiensis TaxID=1337062 RepID=UPI003343AEAA
MRLMFSSVLRYLSSTTLSSVVFISLFGVQLYSMPNLSSLFFLCCHHKYSRIANNTSIQVQSKSSSFSLKFNRQLSILKSYIRTQQTLIAVLLEATVNHTFFEPPLFSQPLSPDHLVATRVSLIQQSGAPLPIHDSDSNPPDAVARNNWRQSLAMYLFLESERPQERPTKLQRANEDLARHLLLLQRCRPWGDIVYNSRRGY